MGIESGLVPIIWLLQDGKAGHQNQALALVEALQRQLPLRLHLIPVPARCWPGIRLLRVLVASRQLERPDLVVGSGHATHGALLVLAALCRCPSLVLMRPSLPLIWFGRVVAPSHDLSGLPPSDRLIASFGPLCRRAIPAAATGPVPQTLVLLGGPSRHHLFEVDGLQHQLAELLAADSQPEGWCLVDSRRTPAGSLEQLGECLGLAPRQLLPWQQCPSGWLAWALSRRPVVWVSEDSLSMLFEAVSAGCRVGVLPMPRRTGRGRWRQKSSLDRLVEMGYALPLETWRLCRELPAPPPPLDEAARVAELLLPWLRAQKR